jgi:hypothetical protein
MHMENLMESSRGSSAQEEEFVEDNFTTIQKLIIKVNALSSTITFSLETMAQHRVLIVATISVRLSVKAWGISAAEIGSTGGKVKVFRFRLWIRVSLTIRR